MVEIELTKMSSKGQIVIPQKFRKGLENGENFLVFRNKEQIILKPASKLDETLAEDIEFANRTERAYKRIEKGESIKIDSEDLFEEMQKW